VINRKSHIGFPLTPRSMNGCKVKFSWNFGFFQRFIDCVDIARRSSARGHQTTVRWQKQVFIHTRLSRAYLALARLSCAVYSYSLRLTAIVTYLLKLI